MKETSLQTFNLITSVEILGKNINLYNTFDNPLFLARDVAEWIDYAKKNDGKRQITQMLKQVDNDEKIKGALGVNIINPQKSNNEEYQNKLANSVYGDITPRKDHRGGLRKNTPQWFLTEDGLYEVLMQSRKPIAKEMKSKIKNYLRDIRKTGGAVEYGSEEKFIESRFSNFSEDTKRAMVTELLASNKVLHEQNETLMADVKVLKTEILTWDDRSKLNAGVRMLASKTHKYFGTIWQELYKELQYKHGICLTNRAHGKKVSLISLVKKHEWTKVMETFSAMCVDYGQSPSKMFQQTLNKN